MKVMILAAGFGKRLGALTRDIPKPLIEVRGKPLIDYHLEKLISAGFNSVSINVHYLANKIKHSLCDQIRRQAKWRFFCQ